VTSASDIHAALVETFGRDAITGENMEAIDPWVEIAPGSIVAVCEFLRDDERFLFDHLNNLCGVDYLQPDAKKAKTFDHPPPRRGCLPPLQLHSQAPHYAEGSASPLGR
jgi:NADH-quinone oxidoreductase subunit C